MIELVCDICGEPIGRNAIPRGREWRRLRVQERRCVFDMWGWAELDCHRECAEAIAAAARERKAKDDER